MHTLNENYKFYSLLHPVAVTASANHMAINVEAQENDAMVLVDVGAVAGTTPTLDLKIQTSEDGVTYTDALAIAQITAGNGVAAGKLHLNKVKTVRAVSTVAGTTPSFTLGIGLLVEVAEKKDGVNSTELA